MVGNQYSSKVAEKMITHNQTHKKITEHTEKIRDEEQRKPTALKRNAIAVVLQTKKTGILVNKSSTLRI